MAGLLISLKFLQIGLLKFFPQNRPNRVISKISFCLKQGTKLGWFVDPEDESVTIFQPNQLPELKEGQDILPVLDVLEDWQLSAADLFGWLSFS